MRKEDTSISNCKVIALTAYDDLLIPKDAKRSLDRRLKANRKQNGGDEIE